MHEALKPALTAASEQVTRVLVASKPTVRVDDEDRRRAEETAVATKKLADDAARVVEEKQKTITEQQARLAAQQAQLEKEKAELAVRHAEAERRAQETHTLELKLAVQIGDLAQKLVDELRSPVEGKNLRVDWRWE